MRETMSLFRAWFYGVSGFFAATAALTMAMTIAITGPPTSSELQSLQRMLGQVAADLGPRVEQLSADMCEQLPPEASLCQSGVVTEVEDVGPKPAGVAYVEPPPPVVQVRDEPDEVIVIEAASRVRDQDLLGGRQEVSRPRATQTRTAQAPRRERAARAPDRTRRSAERAGPSRAARAAPPRRARSTSPPPPIVARQESVPDIPDNSLASPLEELLASTEAILAAEQESEEISEDSETPSQANSGRGDEAPASIAEAWAAPRNERRVEEAAYEEEPYRETYEEYRARRREERAARRREEERRYREQYWPPPPPYRRW
jgi:hypothetical protein